ncbi:hypothetical protein FPOAC2_10570 [Fusarium poae]|jgi:hypothetical protein|uniref:Uncharacterized protein n=1 Tax=Fusarium poae TaxID=36050 RepID=A0A1B8ABE7_FUSPO|nr:hypothetical protein FPOAC1_010292 [Fusarium poae]KAG8665496.1 hypothetical protein FPOAC1_010292 [Fusarium poae]OBS17798.1 hypothetical protein FPOA_09530 [Fusarium poae]
MCKAVRYVYPNCGHPIVQDKYVWSVERCPYAQCCSRDCWIPNDIPQHLIEDTPWPYDNLTEPCPMPHEPSPIPNQSCSMSHERSYSTESATLSARSTNNDQPSCIEFMFTSPPTPEHQLLDDEEMERLIQEFFFQESLPAATSGAIPDEDVSYLDGDDFTLSDDLVLLNEDNHHQTEVSLETEPFSDEQLAYFDEIVPQTGEQLSFPSVEDIIEWEQVRAVQAPLDQYSFGQDMDLEWRFDEWF